MSDMIDMFRAMNEDRKDRRRRLGIDCPRCLAARPRANPRKLLPGQLCRDRHASYRDPRDPDAEENQ